jgi:tRNA-dihydrouridine synthase A
MMQRTDRHFRVFLRQLTRHTLLYTEMVHSGAILRGDTERHLGFDPIEHPIALQLGGDDPTALAAAARVAVDDFGYDEVNLNVGCPSDKVQQGRFGAVLMKDPERVADCVAAMRSAVAAPVTVKHRIGVDDLDDYDHMLHFVDRVAASGADRFSVHARKAWLKGLSPKENRNIPPLRYDEVYRLKRERPHLPVEINGGVKSLDATLEHLGQGLDAVMIGRAAYDDPGLFSQADRRVFGDEQAEERSPLQAVEALLPYVERCLSAGGRLHWISRHLMGLFHGQPGARLWRRHLSEHAVRATAGPEVLREALSHLAR